MGNEKVTIYDANGQPMQRQARLDNDFGPVNPLIQFNPFGAPQFSGFPGTEQISRIDTLEKNLRWYLVSNFRQVLSQAYVEIGLIRTLIDVPVDDGYRGGVKFISSELDADDIKKLVTFMRREKDLEKAKQADKWKRLFGGGAIIFMPDDQDPDEPFSIKDITKDTNIELRVADLWELFYSLQNTDAFDPSFMESSFESYNYYGVTVDKSRVLKFAGPQAPSFIRPRLRGWGLSEVERLIRSINQYMKGTDLAFEVLDEFKLDIYMLEGLATALAGGPQGEAKLERRIQQANMRKNFQNALVLDKKDQYESKQLSFAGLGEVMAGIRMQIASDVRMPLTKLFGISAAGFNSGEDDIEVYNGMVESEIRDDAKHNLLKIAEVRCMQLFGFVPEDLDLEWKPLRVLGATDEETVKTAKFTRLLQAAEAGKISTKQFIERVNAGNLTDIPLPTDDLDIDDDPMAEEILDKVTDEPPAPAPAEKGAKPPAAAQSGPPAPKKIPARKLSNWFNAIAQVLRNPGKVDEALWEKAKRKVMKQYGEMRWAVVTTLYKKMGGRFK